MLFFTCEKWWVSIVIWMGENGVSIQYGILRGINKYDRPFEIVIWKPIIIEALIYIKWSHSIMGQQFLSQTQQTRSLIPRTGTWWKDSVVYHRSWESKAGFSLEASTLQSSFHNAGSRRCCTYYLRRKLNIIII